MIAAGGFIARARAHGFSLYTGVPCSYLKPFINFVIDDPDLCYVGAPNEGDAGAVAAGAELAGRRSVVMFQNSGFGNAVNPLTSLTHTFRIPVLIIVTWRGEPGGAADEPQHDLMGRITPDLLDLLGIPWAWFPVTEADIEPTLAQAVESMDAGRGPFALIMRKGSVAPCALRSTPTVPPPEPATERATATATARRTDMLRAVQRSIAAADIVVATTGYTGRELYALADRPNQLYMVGSMGCAVSFGLGIALARPDRRVIVLDGDGALLMRLGALAMLGERLELTVELVAAGIERQADRLVLERGAKRLAVELARALVEQPGDHVGEPLAALRVEHRAALEIQGQREDRDRRLADQPGLDPALAHHPLDPGRALGSRRRSEHPGTHGDPQRQRSRRPLSRRHRPLPPRSRARPRPVWAVPQVPARPRWPVPAPA